MRITKITLIPMREDLKKLDIRCSVTLNHTWSRIILEEEDVVRIIGTFTSKNSFQLRLDDLPGKKDDAIPKARFLILEPDLLIPSTGISTASNCHRVPLLRELFKNAEGNPNYALILGNVIHLVFQKILENPKGKNSSVSIILDLYEAKNEAMLEKAIQESMQDQLVDLYFIRNEHPETKVVKDIKNCKIYFL